MRECDNARMRDEKREKARTEGKEGRSKRAGVVEGGGGNEKGEGERDVIVSLVVNNTKIQTRIVDDYCP
jgi:hypothetical protein